MPHGHHCTPPTPPQQKGVFLALCVYSGSSTQIVSAMLHCRDAHVSRRTKQQRAKLRFLSLSLSDNYRCTPEHCSMLYWRSHLLEAQKMKLGVLSLVVCFGRNGNPPIQTNLPL
mmetsp:Transcript_93888/g.157695  ORF Transcript_93888/g.157695 Transcript_93888/m.157695 type:complete len:114 (-) Transcript_93888:164-505(-)